MADIVEGGDENLQSIDLEECKELQQPVCTHWYIYIYIYIYKQSYRCSITEY